MVSVIIPAYNEEENIANVIKICKKNKYVNEIIVVNNLCTDRTEEIAKKEGAKVIFCNRQGKGYAMEEGIKAAKNECIVFLDGDINDYVDNVVELLAKPIVEDRADFVKAAFDREHGRVTFLVAQPLLDILYPDMKKYSQPLSGMIAGKKEVFEKIELEKDYGVDIGLLLDVTNMNLRIEEVYIGKIKNVSKDWRLLQTMCSEVMRAIIKRSDIKE